MRDRHLIALAAIVLASATLLLLEGAALATAWLPLEEAATLVRARGGGGALSAGVLYPVLLAPFAHVLSASAAYELARSLSAVLWAATAVPAFLLARRVVAPTPALVVAGLAVAVPASVYATAAVADAPAMLLSACALALLVRASERGSVRELAGALVLAAAAAAARPWLVVLPFALLAAYGFPRPRWRSAVRWPRSLWLAALAGVAYFVLAEISPEAAVPFTSPAATARGALASLVVASVGLAVVPWLFAPFGAWLIRDRPEAALLVTCVPALAVAAGALAAADPRRGVDERPLLVLTPLVLALAAVAWLERGARLRGLAAAGVLLVLASLTLPQVGRAPVARAAGLSVVSPAGGSRAFLVAGIAAAVVVALVLLRAMRRRSLVLVLGLALVLLAGQAGAWSSVRTEADALAANELVERGWIDRRVGPDTPVVVAGRPESLGSVDVAQLALWNRAVRGTQKLDLSTLDPESGQWGAAPAADVVLLRGLLNLSGTPIARSRAGVLLRPETPYRLTSTLQGRYPDKWSTERVVYNRITAPPGTVRIAFDRRGAPATAAPAEIRIEAGPRDEDADELRADFFLRPGERRSADVEVPVVPYRVVVTIAPTFAAADGRQLGARVGFAYRPSASG